MGCGTCFSWNVSQKNLLVAIPSVGIPNIGLTTSINQAHGNTSIDFFHAIVGGFKGYGKVDKFCLATCFPGRQFKNSFPAKRANVP